MSKIEEQVIDKIRARSEHGREKYGTTMERTDITPQGWVKHLQGELMDAAVYAERLGIEIAGFEGSGDAALAIELDRVREVLGRTSSKPSVLIRQLRNRCERQQRVIREARAILGAEDNETLEHAAKRVWGAAQVVTGPSAEPYPALGDSRSVLPFSEVLALVRSGVRVEFLGSDGVWRSSSANCPGTLEEKMLRLDPSFPYRREAVAS